MKINYFVFCISIFISCNHPESKEYISNSNNPTYSDNDVINETLNSFEVIGIKDGDTIVILVDGKQLTVRLSDIDCPEKKQPFGSKAKKFVSDLCYGRYVSLNSDNKFDRNGRLIAEVVLENGKILNKELVKNGLAWHFKKYSKNEEYAELENQAKVNKIGLWSEQNPIAPWLWRKSKRTNG